MIPGERNADGLCSVVRLTGVPLYGIVTSATRIARHQLVEKRVGCLAQRELLQL